MFHFKISDIHAYTDLKVEAAPGHDELLPGDRVTKDGKVIGYKQAVKDIEAQIDAKVDALTDELADLAPGANGPSLVGDPKSKYRDVTLMMQALDPASAVYKQDHKRLGRQIEPKIKALTDELHNLVPGATDPAEYVQNLRWRTGVPRKTYNDAQQMLQALDPSSAVYKRARQSLDEAVLAHNARVDAGRRLWRDRGYLETSADACKRLAETLELPVNGVQPVLQDYPEDIAERAAREAQEAQRARAQEARDREMAHEREVQAWLNAKRREASRPRPLPDLTDEGMKAERWSSDGKFLLIRSVRTGERRWMNINDQ